MSLLICCFWLQYPLSIISLSFACPSRMPRQEAIAQRLVTEALRCLCWLGDVRVMEAVERGDGFPRPSCLHPFIVHELGLPDSCLYLPPLTDACCQSVWEGLQSASPSGWISYEPKKIGDWEEIDLRPVSVSQGRFSPLLNTFNENETS